MSIHHLLAHSREIVRDYPVFVLAIVGLFAGGILYLLFRQPESAGWVWFGTLVVGGSPIVWKTATGMLRRRFASDIVAMLAIIAAIILDQAFAGVIIVLMQSGGEAIENYGFKRATTSLETILARSPRKARRRRDGTLEDIDVNSVNVGDLLVVRQGDLIPVDGTIIHGHAEIDESALTGEPLTRSRTINDHVLSGSTAVDGGFEMRADKISEESQYAKIVELVRKAQGEKPQIQRLADRYSVWFTPITLIVGLVGLIITRNPSTLLAVLVVATPCPLILATPIAVISGINRAAREGIIVKSGAAIEQIGHAQVIAFDKTGTITTGTPIVEKIVPSEGISENELLLKAASVGQFSSHIVAHSLAEYTREKIGQLELPTNFRETPGLGVEGYIDGHHVMVGSQRFIVTNSGTMLITVGRNGRTDQIGKMSTFIIIDGRSAGVIVFSDRIRPGVPEMIEKLQELGVKKTMMLTGDNADNALAVAKLAGISEVEANLLPGQKVVFLHRLKEQYGTTIMVGDGINDAPALATATVGVAMGAHGTGVSSEAADIVLLVDDVTKIVDAVLIGQRMLEVAKQGIAVGLGLSFVFMIIASLGLLQPAIGAMVQEGIDAAVILNALRAR